MSPGRVPPSEATLSNPPHSSIRDHILECIPTIQIKNFTILGMTANNENLKVLESLHMPIPCKQLGYDFLNKFPLLQFP